MSSVTINCNEFADMMNEIIKLLPSVNQSMIFKVLNGISNLIVCKDNNDMLSGLFDDDDSEEYQNEMIRLITECKDSICNKGDSKMTITCNTIRIFLDEDGENAYDEMKKECQKVREQLNKNEDIADIISSLLSKEGYLHIPDNDIDDMMKKYLPGDSSRQKSSLLLDNQTNEPNLDVSVVMNQFNQKAILDKLKTIKKEKLLPIKQLLGLMVKCSCDIDNESSPGNESSPKKKGLSTTVIIIIVVFVLLFLSGMFYLYLQRK